MNSRSLIGPTYFEARGKEPEASSIYEVRSARSARFTHLQSVLAREVRYPKSPVTIRLVEKHPLVGARAKLGRSPKESSDKLESLDRKKKTKKGRERTEKSAIDPDASGAALGRFIASYIHRNKSSLGVVKTTRRDGTLTGCAGRCWAA
ncbi:hypothetical protein KM043_014798 [Ampulex compressa]|nr:hypothetical protein KM043_014798 [Ampulex compressa]